MSHQSYTEADQLLIQALAESVSQTIEEVLIEHQNTTGADNATLTCIANDICITVANSFASIHFGTKLPRGEFLYLRGEIQREITSTYKKHLASLN